jgi:hypothetical protein
VPEPRIVAINMRMVKGFDLNRQPIEGKREFPCTF